MNKLILLTLLIPVTAIAGDCFTYYDTEGIDKGVCCVEGEKTTCVKNTGEVVTNRQLTIPQIIACDSDADCCSKNPNVDKEFCRGSI